VVRRRSVCAVLSSPSSLYRDLAYLISRLIKGKGITSSTGLIHTASDLIGTRPFEDTAGRYHAFDRRFVSGAGTIRALLPASILHAACHRSDAHDYRIRIVRIETIGIVETGPHLGTHTTLAVFVLGTILRLKTGPRFYLALSDTLLLC